MFPPLSKRSKRKAASSLNLLCALLLRDTDCNNVKGKEKLTLYKEYKKRPDKLQAVLRSHTLHSAHLAVNAMVKL